MDYEDAADEDHDGDEQMDAHELDQDPEFRKLSQGGTVDNTRRFIAERGQTNQSARSSSVPSAAPTAPAVDAGRSWGSGNTLSGSSTAATPRAAPFTSSVSAPWPR